jgi:hypothetical protein
MENAQQSKGAPTLVVPPLSWSSLSRTARAAIGVAVLIGLALLVLPQMRDILVGFSDVSLNHLWARIAYHFSLFFLAFNAWFWARTVLAARFDIYDSRDERRNVRAGQFLSIEKQLPIDADALEYLPRFLFLGIALGGLLAALKSSDIVDVGITFVWSSIAFWVLRNRLRIRSWFGGEQMHDETTRRRRLASRVDQEPSIKDVGQLPMRARIVELLTRIPRRLAAAFEQLVSHAPFSRILAIALIGLGIAFFVLSAVGTFAPGFARWSRAVVGLVGLLPGPAALLFCLGLALGPLTLLTYWLDRYHLDIRLYGILIFAFRRPPVLTLLAALIFVTPQIVSLHNVRVIEEPAAQMPDRRGSLEYIFDKWKSTCAKGVTGGKKVRPIIVAISGGASRAGLWGARVLTLVDSIVPQGETSIFAVSSVSGGSLGAAAYLAALAGQKPDAKDKIDKSPCTLARWYDPKRDDTRGDAIRDAVSADALGPALAGSLLGDVARAFFGLPAALVRLVTQGKDAVGLRGGDRAEALERAFEHNWSAVSSRIAIASGGAWRPFGFDNPYLSLFYEPPATVAAKGADSNARLPPLVPRGNVPLWLANGTDAQNGDRLITAPFPLAFDGEDRSGQQFSAARDVLALLQSDIPVSTAITNTARFPYLSPSGELEPVRTQPKPYAQIIDGGYFENEGAQTALELAHWLKAHGADPIIIQVTADAETNIDDRDIVRCGHVFRDQPDRVRTVGRPLQLFAPLEGVYTVRAGHSQVVLREIYDEFCAPDRPSFFHFYLYRKDDEDIPLNWVLSDSIADYIWRREMLRCPNRVEFEHLRNELRKLVPRQVELRSSPR